MQFRSEIILIIIVILNRTNAQREFDFEIMRMISDQIALHSVQFIIINQTLDYETFCILNAIENFSLELYK